MMRQIERLARQNFHPHRCFETTVTSRDVDRTIELVVSTAITSPCSTLPCGFALEMPYTMKRIWDMGIVLAARKLHLDLDKAVVEPKQIILTCHGEELIKDMKLRDLHALIYLSTGNEICKTVQGGEPVNVPLFLSSMTDADYGKQLKLFYQLTLTNTIGETALITTGTKMIDYQPYVQKDLEPLTLDIPNLAGLAMITLRLEDLNGIVLHHNFMHLEVMSDMTSAKTEVLSVAPANFSSSQWTTKQWNILDGLKVCGAGSGYFEYTFKLNNVINWNAIKEAYFLIEISAKELFVKDRDQKEKTDVEFMLGGKASPSGNPNSYPMTDETKFPSKVVVVIDGATAMTTTLEDDPADHRGVLSWHHQLKDRKLREAGSYGYLTKVPVSKKLLKSALAKGELVIQLKTVGEGGIAVYGKSFGRYPLDPSLVIKYK